MACSTIRSSNDSSEEDGEEYLISLVGLAVCFAERLGATCLGALSRAPFGRPFALAFGGAIIRHRTGSRAQSAICGAGTVTAAVTAAVTAVTTATGTGTISALTEVALTDIMPAISPFRSICVIRHRANVVQW